MRKSAPVVLAIAGIGVALAAIGTASIGSFAGETPAPRVAVSLTEQPTSSPNAAGSPSQAPRPTSSKRAPNAGYSASSAATHSASKAAKGSGTGTGSGSGSGTGTGTGKRQGQTAPNPKPGRG